MEKVSTVRQVCERLRVGAGSGGQDSYLQSRRLCACPSACFATVLSTSGNVRIVVSLAMTMTQRATSWASRHDVPNHTRRQGISFIADPSIHLNTRPHRAMVSNEMMHETRRLVCCWPGCEAAR